MYMPSDWKKLGREKPDPKKPWLGSWRYASPNAKHKIFVRVTPAEQGPLDKIMAAGGARLKKSVKDLKEALKPATQKDKKGREFLVAPMSGILNVRDPQTKKVTAAEHTILRVLQRFPDAGIQFFITYLSGADRQHEILELAQAHLAGFDPIDTKEKLELAKRLTKVRKTIVKQDAAAKALSEPPKK
jgi:hypothetical protein